MCVETLAASNLLGLQRLTQLCEKTLYPLLDAENVRICIAFLRNVERSLVVLTCFLRYSIDLTVTGCCVVSSS